MMLKAGPEAPAAAAAPAAAPTAVALEGDDARAAPEVLDADDIIEVLLVGATTADAVARTSSGTAPLKGISGRMGDAAVEGEVVGATPTSEPGRWRVSCFLSLAIAIAIDKMVTV
jgi:hypothetical protein